MRANFGNKILANPIVGLSVRCIRFWGGQDKRSAVGALVWLGILRFLERRLGHACRVRADLVIDFNASAAVASIRRKGQLQ